MSAISLIVGLGNPGTEHAQTRHNAGFRFMERLFSLKSVHPKFEGKFQGQVARFTVVGHELWGLLPQTFMNHSGESVSTFAHFYKIPVEQILVVHDELDLPPGTARFKMGGGDGGHNGLKDVTEKMGSGQYARLRLGIGHPGASHLVVSYVLKRAPSSETVLLDESIERALAELPDIVHGQFQKAMNALHAK
jgi:PTH1 family peptidyl-tRNA hydrolase